MRIHPWLAALSSVSLLFAAGERSAHAQQTTDGIFQSAAFDEALEGHVQLTSESREPNATASPGELRGQSPGRPPVVFEPAYTSNNPADLWPPGTPQTYQPYPQISPYYPPNVSRTETFNRDGLWFRDMLYREREYFMTLEYLMVRYRNPGNEVVGNQPAPFFKNTPGGVAAGGGGAGGGGAGALVSGGLVGFPIDNLGLAGPALIGIVNPDNTANRLQVGPGVWPYPVVNQDVVTFAGQSLVDEDIFPIRSLGHFDNHFKTDGMRARWGFFNEDASGLMLTGWFGTEARDKFQAGVDAVHGIVIDQAFLLAQSPTGGQSPVFPRNGSLPLLLRDDILEAAFGGLFNIVGYTGVPQKYDVMFKYQTSSFASGGAVHLYHEPVYKRKWVTVRPAFGARYQYLEERLGFRGIDSGFGYPVDFGAFGGGGAAGGQQQIPLFRPDSPDVNVPLDQNGVGFFLDSRLDSQIDSHMGGPEVGFRYDFGSGKNFAIWGQSMFGLLANHQRMQLEGDDIGDPRLYWLATGGIAGGVNFTDEVLDVDTDFFEEDNHTHASPMFEQSVFIDVAVFQHIPVLKKLHVLENARFRTGYTYLVIGGVNRPAESIVWRGFPEFPTIRNNDRKTWHTHNWSFAIDWRF